MLQDLSDKTLDTIIEMSHSLKREMIDKQLYRYAAIIRDIEKDFFIEINNRYIKAKLLQDVENEIIKRLKNGF